MATLNQVVVNFLKRADGPTAVEYAVMMALFIVVVISAVTTIGLVSSQAAPSQAKDCGAVGALIAARSLPQDVGKLLFGGRETVRHAHRSAQ